MTVLTRPPRPSVRRGFERHAPTLRRFAGHALHAEQLETPLRVAHLTDLHVGLVTPLAAQEAAVSAANACRPDLVAMTGDFVCFGQGWLTRLTELLARIEAPAIAVLGNHDHWSGATEVRRALEKAGVAVLQNEHTVLEIRGQRLQVVGVDDAFTGHADQRAATRGLRRDLPSVGLSHVGEEAEGLWSAGVPLVLSGHTHGGQVTWARFDRLLMNHVLGHRYVHGLYGSRTAPPPSGALYVGAGIGAPRIPFRFGERGRRELAVFELGAVPGSFDEHHDEQVGWRGRKPHRWLKRRRAAIVHRERRRRDAVKALRSLLRRR